MSHKNSFKRLYHQDSVYFITARTYSGIQYFKETIFCQLFIDDLIICKKLKGFRLLAFVIIPWHIHLLLKPSNKFNISQIGHSLKKQFSHDVNVAIGKNKWYPWKGKQIGTGAQTDERLPVEIQVGELSKTGEQTDARLPVEN